jgi:hypothetical protein
MNLGIGSGVRFGIYCIILLPLRASLNILSISLLATYFAASRAAFSSVLVAPQLGHVTMTSLSSSRIPFACMRQSEQRSGLESDIIYLLVGTERRIRFVCAAEKLLSVSPPFLNMFLAPAQKRARLLLKRERLHEAGYRRPRNGRLGIPPLSGCRWITGGFVQEAASCWRSFPRRSI